MTHHYRTTRYLTVPAVAALLLAVSTLAQDAKPVLHTVRGTIERNVRQTFATLHNFCSEGGSTCTDGSGPNAPLIQGADGSLYGTTSYGGPGGVGTIFKITSSGTLTTLHIFCSESDCADGAFPSGGLILANDGNFYGVTVYGGVLGVGTVFKMTPSGTLTTFYNFCSVLYCDDGSAPNGGLIQAADGNFYGTTTTGGASQPNQIGFGVIFQLTPSGTLTPLYSFCPEGGSTCTAGSSPNASLIQGADGSLYGTTSYGGPEGVGTMFKITTSGKLTLLHTFCSASDCADGAFPSGGLIEAKDGNFYGVTVYGGVLGVGTVFKMTPSGTLTTFYNFCSVLYCDDGSAPNGGLIQAPNGNFYGTTTTGGASQPNQIGDGVVYEISPAGKLTTLHSFDGTDGYFPIASLVQYGGSLYGTTFHGGANGSGTLFRLLARPAAVPRF